MSTFEELVQKTIVELKLENGVAVQAYAEDTIAAKLQRVFNALFDQYFFPRYTATTTYTLDGSTGKVTATLTSVIKRADDIKHIWYATNTRELPRKPSWINPNALTGGIRRYWEPVADNKIFRILPITTTGNVTVSYRTKPADFTAGDTVYMDDDLLVSGAVFDWLVDEGENEMAVKKWKGIFDARESQIRQALNSGPIPFGTAAPSPFTDWMSE